MKLAIGVVVLGPIGKVSVHANIRCYLELAVGNIFASTSDSQFVVASAGPE